MSDQAMTKWLTALGLERFASVLRENEVDIATLKILNEKDLIDLGLPFGPRKRLLRALSDLNQSEAEPAAEPRSQTASGAADERRQLTVLFCDMVGFTELASRLDPEVLHGIIKSYEDACTACLSRYEGYLFQRLGDGIVAFFGYPFAHEGEAERAVRAGLEIIDAFGRLEVPEAGRLQVRIGIATGVVVVSSAGKAVSGETMNLAARLQALATPGTILVSDRVHRVAGGAFDYTDLGEQPLKGITTPTRVYRVVGASSTPSRFEAAHPETLTPLVGREQEIELLLDRWRRARSGAGQIVHFSGEPGIGKSRIASSLRGRLELQGAFPLRFQCSPYHVNSAFYPCIDHLERALGLTRDTSATATLDKLEAMVVGQYQRPLKDVRFLATVLSIPCQERYGALPGNPKRQKQATVRVLVDMIEATARTRPTFMLFEDVHWADPTTLEVLDLLVERVQTTPLMVVLTSRPEFPSRWSKHDHVTAVTLNKLTPGESDVIMAGVTRGKALPADLHQQIIEKTDGVPLFVEELTKAVLESGNLAEEKERYVYSGTARDMAVPATLRDSLMARLDRVPRVKEIAQIGATVGREFSYELLSVVTHISKNELDDTLDQLTKSGLAFRRGVGAGATYVFKHALVQDTAYDSLLKARRQELHAKIAVTLQDRFPDTVRTSPEVLAQHFAAGGVTDAAVSCWRNAGELALKRYALPEAIAHLRSGLKLVESLPPGPGRDLEELGLRTLLGPALVALLGWAKAEVGVVLGPAWVLAEKLGHRESYLPILHGLWVHNLSLGRLRESLTWAETLLAAGEAANDGDLEIVGHRAASASYYWMGDLVSARHHGDVVQRTYDSKRHWHIAPLTNTDPLTGEGIYRVQYLWMLGYPDQALAASTANEHHARRRNHPFDLAFALTLGAEVFDYRSEPDALLRRTEEAERVGSEYGVPLLSEVLAEISKGIAWLLAGRVADSVGQLQISISRLRDTGHAIWVWYLQAVLAEALAQSGDLQGAMTLIDESIDRLERGEERAHYAEVLRVKGWLLVQQGNPQAAEPFLRAAIDFARRQQSRSWELRAATTLANLLVTRGATAAARDLLAPLYNSFDEGLNTKDLLDAKALLAKISAE